MSKKTTNKYLIPVELTKYQPYKWLDVKTYQYKLFADDTETKFTKIKFIEINGVIIIGEHMPTKLQTVYDKAATQLKNNTVKAVTEISQAVNGVADIAVDAVSVIRQDVSKTANIAVGLFGKIKNIAKEKIQKNTSTNSTEQQPVKIVKIVETSDKSLTN